MNDQFSTAICYDFAFLELFWYIVFQQLFLSTLTMDQLFDKNDGILWNFSFPEPIESLQTCISVAALLH